MTTPEVKQRAQDYCDRRGYSIDSRLGVGTQGSVYVVNIPYLDRPPDYSAEVWADWEEMKSMAFEDNWPHVKRILTTFETFGIYIADVNPGNIKFD